MRINPSTSFSPWWKFIAVTARNRGVGFPVGRFPDVREEFFQYETRPLPTYWPQLSGFITRMQ